MTLKITNINTSSASYKREIKEYISTVDLSYRGRSRHFKDRKIPLPLTKIYIYALLTELDYLNKTYRIIYTDLKLENIMVSLGDPAVLADFMDSQLENR
ncbi:uncharacterized protein N7500_001196 [Penicillium coprophilum]|uniref:uncharacterized protein n=1 Tax=Penicillium coprophilum TaxID=36646 RepID=UPI00238631D3|nr:uncharacterized protein N7500_001196 [Penicillium coprophilum]KAJ5178497.1 hypothetical protein N7500_001196 [Penicillium coprophilum]